MCKYEIRCKRCSSVKEIKDDRFDSSSDLDYLRFEDYIKGVARDVLAVYCDVCERKTFQEVISYSK